MSSRGITIYQQMTILPDKLEFGEPVCEAEF